MPEMLAVRTLRQHMEWGFRLFAHCSHDHTCTHFAEVGWSTLIQHFGWDFELVRGRDELRSKLRCSRCGRFWPQIQIAVRDTTSGDRAGVHPTTAITDPSKEPKGVSYAEALERWREFRKTHPDQSTGRGRPRQRRR